MADTPQTRNDLTRVLDDLDRAGTAGFAPEEAASTYTELRTTLHRLVVALAALDGDYARIGTVLENLLSGADQIVSETQARS
jgi:hypothetical protein